MNVEPSMYARKSHLRATNSWARDELSKTILRSLVVSFSSDPGTGAEFAEEEFSGLVVAENEDGEWKCWQPPGEQKRVHTETLVHARGVAEEDSQNGLKDQAEIHEPVGHSLLED